MSAAETMSTVKRTIVSAREAAMATASSAWVKPWLKGGLRAAGFVAGVALLALVGSGRMARWLVPPRDLGIGVAQAAPAPVTGDVAATTTSVAAQPAPEPSSAPGPEIGAPAVAGDADGGASAVEAGDAGAASAGIAADGKVILNLASEEDLRRLPGVGHGRAQAILALRQRMKKFTRVEDLLKVKGIGRRGLARLRPLVRID
jgi:competence protein ComEA